MSESQSSAQDEFQVSTVQATLLKELFQVALESGGRPRIEDYLPLAPAAGRSSLLLELVQLEFAFLRRQGDCPDPGGYERRFPELKWDRMETVVFSTDHIAGVRDAARAPQASPRCPYCHNSLENIATVEGEVVCPACGSAFRFVDCHQPSTMDALRRLDEFHLQIRVGRGAFGEVWKAWDDKLKRHVAIKIPFRTLLTHPNQIERFEREAQNAARLRHPGIVSLHGVRTIDGMPIIITDFIDGMNLREYLERQPLKFPESAAIAAQLADALDYAHGMRLVHRDIKPGNIMMERCGRIPAQSPAPAAGGPEGTAAARPAAYPHAPPLRPIIVDFGLALQTEADVVLTMEGQLVGTVAYMSPEQARGRGHEADARSDVYSVGIVLYEMLTGVPPFRGSRAMILDQVLREEPRRPRKLNDKIPRDLEIICLKAISKEPAKRYQTARAFADDLRCYLEDRPIQARPAGGVERVIRWCKRNPKLAAVSGLAAVCLLAFMAVLGFAYYVQRDAANKSQRRAATYALDRALSYLEQNEGAQGVLWLGRAAELAPPHANDLQEVIRSNLAAWLDRVHPLVGIFPHQMRLVGRAVLTKDGKTAVTIGEDQCFLWDTARSELRVPPLKHADAIYSVALDSEGRFLVTASADGTACVWDVSTGQRRGSPLQHPKPVKRASFDRQGTRVITVCADKVVRLWNVADGALLEPALAHDYDVSDAIVTRDGQFVFTSTNDKKAYLWSTADGACVRKWECVEGYPVSAISPDGQSIALATGANALKCYTPQGELRWEHRNLPLSQISAIRFSPGGERLLTVSQDFSMSKESTAQLWRADTGKSLAPPSPHANLAVFNPDGHFILTGSDDTTARVRDAGTGLTIGLPLHHQGAVRAISVSGDGDLILTASWDSKARLWRRSTFALPKGFEHDEKVWAAVFDPIHRTLVTAAGKPFGSGSAQIWNLETGQREGSPLRQDSLITVLSVSPGGTSLATGGDSGGTRIWDLSSGQESARIQETGLVSAVVFLPDGRRLLTGSLHDKKVRVWDIPSRAQIGTSWEHPQEVTAVAISPKADLAVTGCADRRARLWHVEGGTLVREFLHLDWVNAVAYCPDGKRIGTGSSDRTAAIWDATNGKQLFSLRHPDVVRTIAFSPNGKILATGCHDGYARLWDVATGLLLGPPFPLTSRLVDGRWIPSRVWTVAFSPDGTQLFCGGDDKIGRLWPVPRPLEGSVADIVRHIKVITGMELDDAGAARDLPDDVWRQLKAADAFH